MTFAIRLVLSALPALAGAALGFALVALAPGCAVPPPAPPVPADACAAAEATLARLECTTDGVETWAGFATACELSAEDGVDWHPACIAVARTCDAAADAWLRGCAP